MKVRTSTGEVELTADMVVRGMVFAPKDIIAAEVAKRERREREAALVALVNNVPAELDPVGWRAAVLAYCEARTDRRRRVDNGTWEDAIAICLRRAIEGESDKFPEVVAAYHRALAPRAKVAPERKTRGPVIVVDDGRDE